jgi:hypothetical protein
MQEKRMGGKRTFKHNIIHLEQNRGGKGMPT